MPCIEHLTELGVVCGTEVRGLVRLAKTSEELASVTVHDQRSSG